MATEFIDYQDDKGFFISDAFIQLLVFYVQEELKKNQYFFSNKNLFITHHTSIINGYYNGWLTLPWKRILINSTEEQTMIQILQTVKTTIQNKGAFVSVSELQSIPTNDDDFKLFYRKPFPTSELIKILDALIQMLQGTWTSTDYDMEINYRY